MTEAPRQPATAQDVPSATEPTGSALATLLAPYRYVLQPARAAVVFLAGPSWARWVGYAVGLMLLAGAVVLCALLSETCVFTSLEGTSDVSLLERSVGEVWRDWSTQHGSALIPAAYWAVPSWLICTAALLVLAWLHWSANHRSGSWWRSYQRIVATCASGSGVVLLAALVEGLIVGWFVAAETRSNTPFFVFNFWGPFTIMLLGELGILAIVVWTQHACWVAGRGVRPSVPRSPTCEQCGYDLSHQPREGRCPECGQNVGHSVDAPQRQVAASWTGAPNTAARIETIAKLVVEPVAFYRRLPVWADDLASRRFCAWHYRWLGAATVVWMLAGLVIHRIFEWEPFVLSVLVGLFVGLASWGLHRIIGALQATWWLINGWLPDLYPLHRVIQLESAYLWVIWIVNAGMIAVFPLIDEMPYWQVLRDIVQNTFGIPLDPSLWLAANATLGGVWLWRYHVARLAVQWANH